MKDENGKEMSEKQKIKEALDLLSDACCFLFETDSTEGQSLGWMVDAALKYGQVIYRDHDILSAAADYTSYENEVYQEKLAKDKKKKSKKSK